MQSFRIQLWDAICDHVADEVLRAEVALLGRFFPETFSGSCACPDHEFRRSGSRLLAEKRAELEGLSLQRSLNDREEGRMYPWGEAKEDKLLTLNTDRLRVIVFHALENAVDNGYEDVVINDPANSVAADLIYWDADLEDKEIEEVVPFVKEWRRR